MGSTIVSILIVAVIVYLLRLTLKSKKEPKIDYSFGLVEAKDARELLLQKKYEELEFLILQLNSDNLTQTIDHLALTLDKTYFTKWMEACNDQNVVKLCLGVHFLHEAWVVRTGATANKVSEKKANQFFEFLELSLEQLNSVSSSSKLISEVNSRLIRLYMGMGETELIHECFQKAISKDKNILWPYLHYCNAIEPKWGGEIELLTELQNNLPKVSIIQYLIELKIILDSFGVNENYFGGTMEELNEKAKLSLEQIDNKISITPLTSIHKYVVYGYLYSIALNVSNKKLEKKYKGMMNGNYALFPFGIMK